LDDDTILAAAVADPTRFIGRLDRAVIDEVQRAPALTRAIKLAVDTNRRPRRFLLTGSSDFFDHTEIDRAAGWPRRDGGVATAGAARNLKSIASQLYRSSIFWRSAIGWGRRRSDRGADWGLS
jgi:hypothetical protein